MRKSILKHLLLPLLVGLSYNLNAATTPASLPNEPMPAVSQTQTPSSLLNLNTADALMLQQELTGIGKAKAEAIVAYRDANGPFASVDELLEIKGIGNALLERNRGKLVVE